MANWLIVERLENWEADKRDHFRHLGIPTRYLERFKSMPPGDKLFIYIASRISAFADLRSIAPGGVAEAKSSGSPRYDTLYPWLVPTKPILVLERENWVDIRPLVPKLTLFSKGDWRLAVRHTIRELPPVDAVAIERAMKSAAHKRMDSPPI